jgi:hypothetical protein
VPLDLNRSLRDASRKPKKILEKLIKGDGSGKAGLAV